MKRNYTCKLIIVLLCAIKIRISFAEPSRPDLPKDDTGTWAFQKHDIFFNEETGFTKWTNLNFGAFGASKARLTFRCEGCREALKQHVNFYLDNLNSSLLNSYLLDARNIRNNGEDFEESDTLNFDLMPQGGVHDVYIVFPKGVKPFHLTSVQYYSADPLSGQWYYLVVHWNGKALTGCNHGEFACAHPLHGGKSQIVRFDKDRNGGYKIVSAYDDKVWSVKDGSSEDHATLVLETFSGLPHQIWFIEEYDEAYRLHPKHNINKCLDLTWGHVHNGAKLVSHFCNQTPAQTFNIIMGC